MYSNEKIFINDTFSAKSVLKVDEEICYLDQGVLHVVNGSEFRVSKGSDKLVQVGPKLVLVSSSEDSPPTIEIPNEENSNLQVYTK